MMRLAASAAALLVTAGAHAADFATTRVGNLHVLSVSGEIVEGDAQRFVAAADPLTGPVLVALHSPGGRVAEALAIGESIRLRHMMTGVGSGSVCASACGLIWLAGAPRLVGTTARIGFHAASVGEGWAAHEAGSGNAIVGAYLSELGYSINAIAYLTRAAPSEMQWLTPDDAHKLGIDFIAVPEPEATAHAAAPAVPAAPVADNTLEKAAAATVLRYFAQWSSTGADVAGLAGFYGQSVSFYGKEMPATTVMTEKRKFAERWPVRDFTVRADSLYVRCADVCAVSGVVEWRVSSAARGVRSTGSASFVFKLAGDAIVSENGAVISNRTDPLPASEAQATASPPSTPAFAEGRRDRISYEQWFNALGEGAYRSGALYYAANRSARAGCDVGSDAAFIQGCLAARQRLQVSDGRRQTEADYRSGWNSL